MAIPKHIKYDVLKRDGYKCKSCGSTKELTIDHILPLSNGGTDDLNNLETMCYDCNQTKASHPKRTLKSIIFNYIVTRRDFLVLRNEARSAQRTASVAINKVNALEAQVNELKLKVKDNTDIKTELNNLKTFWLESDTDNKNENDKLLRAIHMLVDRVKAIESYGRIEYVKDEKTYKPIDK